ncbi:MAG: carboxypeptidase-like regulatory domain-containing protein [Conexivisphaerales archaeon]
MNPIYSASNLDYLSQTDLTDSPNAQGRELALRFYASSSETLQSISFNVIGATNDANGQLVITLRQDNETAQAPNQGVSHPSSLKYAPAMATATVNLAQIYQNLKPSPSWMTSKYEWVNVTFTSGNLNLVAGHYYWLVFNVTPSTDTVTFSRLVNPHVALVYTSGNDFSQTWGVPSDGPTDLAFQIVTSGETISNLLQYQTRYSLAGGAYLAQSFESSTSFQLKGLWLYLSSNGGSADVMIESDSGSDSPSNKVLAYGNITANRLAPEGMEYVSLNFPVNISANTKYWIVVKGDCYYYNSHGCQPAYGYVNVYRPDADSLDYGGASLHYEYTTNGGTAWVNPSPEGDMVFLLEASTTPIKLYNTSTLYKEISTKDNQYPSSGPLVGWDTFLNYYQAMLEYNLTQLMAGYVKQLYLYSGLGKNILQSVPNFNPKYVRFFTGGAAGALSCEIANPACGGSPTVWPDTAVKYLTGLFAPEHGQNNTVFLGSSLGSSQDNGGNMTPTELQTEYLFVYPLIATNQILTMNDYCAAGAQYLCLQNYTETEYARYYTTILNRMAYTGGYFGYSKNAVKVLWFGSSDDGITPQFITPAVNITYFYASQVDNNLTNMNLNQFNVIIGTPNNPTQSFLNRLQAFVKNGGGYISLSFGSTANSMDKFLGLQTSSISVTTTSTLNILQSNQITNPYTSISFNPYWLRYHITPMSNETPTILVTDSNNNPVIAVNNYFNGRGVLLEMPTARLSYAGNSPTFSGIRYGSPRDSWFTLFINAIFYAAHKESMLPIVWESTYSSQQNWSPYLQFSIDGSPGQVLLWLSNNDSVSSPFDLHLNASFYGINPNGWLAINMQNMQVVAKGTGTDIHISTTVPAKTWEPIYIFSLSNGLKLLYSTASITSSSSTNNSLTLSTSSGPSTSQWIILETPQPVTSVSSSSSGSISNYQSISSLNKTIIGYICTSILNSVCTTWSEYNQQGWYFDPSNSLLYVHFTGGKSVAITVNTPIGTSQSSNETNQNPPQQQNSSNTSSSTQYLSIKVSPAIAELYPGENASYTIDITSSNVGEISINVSGLPDGIGASITPSTGTSNFTSQLIVAVPLTASPGNYTFEVNAAGQNASSSALAQLEVLQHVTTSSALYTVSVMAFPSGGGGVSPAAGTYNLPEGSSFTLMALPSTGWVLQGWIVNGNYLGNQSEMTLTVDQNYTVLAEFLPESYINVPKVLVSVSSNAPGAVALVDGQSLALPTSLYWVEGTTHVLQVQQYIYVSSTSRFSFTRWTGPLTSTYTTLPVVADSNLSLTANYARELFVSLNFKDNMGNIISIQNAQVSSTSGSQSVPLDGGIWLNPNETYYLEQGYWHGVNVAEGQQGEFSGQSLSFVLPIYNYSVVVSDVFGQPVSGAKVSIYLPDGSVLTGISSSKGIAYFDQVPLGNYKVTITYLGFSSAINASIAGSSEQKVMLIQSYPFFAAITVFIAGLASLAARQRLRKASE